MRPPGLAGHALPSRLGSVALVFGVAALGLCGPMSAEAIQERRMPLEDVRAAVMRLGYTLVRPVVALLWLHATVLF